MRKRWHGCISTFSAITEKSWLSESEEKSRNYQLCRGIHSDCSLYYTEGVLKNSGRKVLSALLRAEAEG